MVTREYRTARNIIGPLILVEGVEGISYGELTDIKTAGQDARAACLKSTATRPSFRSLKAPAGSPCRTFPSPSAKPGNGVSADMLGRLDGAGRPIDEAAHPREMAQRQRQPDESLRPRLSQRVIQTDLHHRPSEYARARPELPIFPPPTAAFRMAAQIARQAKVLKTGERFAVIFAAMGITFEESEFFIKTSAGPAPSSAPCCSSSGRRSQDRAHSFPGWPSPPRSSHTKRACTSS